MSLCTEKMENQRSVKKYITGRCAAGSYTVEAALVMPMIILILVIAVYIICYLHDRYILRVYADRMAQECCWLYMENEKHTSTAGEEDITGTVSQKYDAELENQLLVMKLEKSLGTCRKNILTHKYTATWNVVGIPGEWVKTEPFIRIQSVVYEGKYERIHVRRWIYSQDFISGRVK